MDPGRRQAFTDAWNIYKQFEDCSSGDEYWERLMRAEKEIEAGSSNKEFLRDLLWAVNQDIKRRLKG